MAGPHHQPPNFTKNEWRDYMKAEINRHVDDAPVLNESWMILKPPQALLEVKPWSYKPKLVAIGPLYHNPKGSPIDNYKALCMKKFMERNGISDVQHLTQDLISAQPHELPHIYDLDIHNSDFEWLGLLVTVDTVFIHEYLLYLSVPQPMETVSAYFHKFLVNDNILSPYTILRDLLLIGNQIPMSFLKKISTNPNFSLDVLEETMRKLIADGNPFFSGRVRQSKFLEILESRNIKLIDTCEHLLDCLYFSCTVLEESRTSDYSCFSFPRKLRLPTASQLCEAGISFKACEGNISVMKYDKRKLKIHLPRLTLVENTEVTLRNVLAYEQQTVKDGGEFTMYVKIMDMLIDTEEDLAILTKANVLENHLGNHIWKDLCTNLVIYGTSRRLREMMLDILAHYCSRWRRS